jgi:Uncharacterized domain/protein associated with RNAses G and E
MMKMRPKKNEQVLIHSYKHDGKIHRCWSKGLVLEATDEHTIVINNRTLVIESDGRRWYTREPAICYFPTNDWYNVICMIRKNGVYYYCNLASPTLYDDGTLKYIDYDLDLKVFPDKKYKVLDIEEYKLHQSIMQYDIKIDKILHDQMEKLIQLIKEEQGVFEKKFAEYWYSVYTNDENVGRDS